MASLTFEELNRRFGLQGQLKFQAGAGGLPFARISNRAAAASICLLGATVVEYQPVGTGPVLWASRLSKYEAGASIRGGIPVCWPWFALHPNPALPPHGFVYGMLWEVVETDEVEAGETRIELKLTSGPETRQLWEPEFELRMVIRVGCTLDVSFTMCDTGRQAFELSGALHNFFAVSDLRQIEINGLDQVPYLSKTPAGAAPGQPGPFKFGPEINRTYPDHAGSCVIHDPGWNRKIWISKTGSRSTVIWNPGAERTLADFPDMDGPDYLKMICVEPAILPQEHFSLAPGAEYTVSEQVKTEF